MFNSSAGRATIISILGGRQDKGSIPISVAVVASCIAEKERRLGEERGRPAPATAQPQLGQLNQEPVVSVPRADKALAQLQIASHE